jgi:hypothetical protein
VVRDNPLLTVSSCLVCMVTVVGGWSFPSASQDTKMALWRRPMGYSQKTTLRLRRLYSKRQRAAKRFRTRVKYRLPRLWVTELHILLTSLIGWSRPSPTWNLTRHINMTLPERIHYYILCSHVLLRSGWFGNLPDCGRCGIHLVCKRVKTSQIWWNYTNNVKL